MKIIDITTNKDKPICAVKTDFVSQAYIIRIKILGLQQYTELSSIRDMGSGEPAYHIASPILRKVHELSRTCKFPDKIYLCFNSHWQPLFPGDMNVVSAMRESVCMLRDPVNLKISIIGKYTASCFRFY